MITTVVANDKIEFEALNSLGGRGSSQGSDVEENVKKILEDVKNDGDNAILAYTEKFDGKKAAEGGIVSLNHTELKKAYESLEPGLAKALLHASENIREYHKKQVVHGYETKYEDGVVIGQIIRGLEKVGLYVPGGKAAYPSTVLMNAIPAKIAGVEELVMVTPPRLDASGDDYPTDTAILAAAWLAGVDKVIMVGGAQAVAALAYGSETIPRVDKIVGPGNVFVTTAKRILYGQVDIDMIAGPSEILILADDGANASYVAADLLSQAEHDQESASILLTTSKGFAKEVSLAIESQLNVLSREDIARISIENNGLIIICRSEDEMVMLANKIAPEHLEIMMQDSLGILPRIKNAGSVFCGHYTPEPVGDYYSGTNHVLPTSGTARFASPLGVYDFVKRMSYTQYTKEALEKAKDDIIEIANAEGLTAHANSVKVRFNRDE